MGRKRDDNRRLKPDVCERCKGNVEEVLDIGGRSLGKRCRTCFMFVPDQGRLKEQRLAVNHTVVDTCIECGGTITHRQGQTKEFCSRRCMDQHARKAMG